jgi:hypothetical protein
VRSEEQLKARAAVMARAAVGKTMGVRLSPDKHPGSTAAARTVRGPIVECSFARFAYNARSVAVVWQVVIEAGVSKTRHVVYLKSLPR